MLLGVSAPGVPAPGGVPARGMPAPWGVPAPGGVPAPRGACSGGCLVPEGVSALGGCLLLGGVCSRGVCLMETPHGYCCGRYASYWNAFLFRMFSHLSWSDSSVVRLAFGESTRAMTG